jgi:hypothetical protein
MNTLHNVKISPPIVINHEKKKEEGCKKFIIDTQKYLYFQEHNLPIQCFNCGYTFNQIDDNKYCCGECYYSYIMRKNCKLKEHIF